MNPVILLLSLIVIAILVDIAWNVASLRDEVWQILRYTEEEQASMAEVKGCGCGDCIHNEDGECQEDFVRIDYIECGGGWEPMCTKYEEEE